MLGIPPVFQPWLFLSLFRPVQEVPALFPGLFPVQLEQRISLSWLFSSLFQSG